MQFFKRPIILVAFLVIMLFIFGFFMVKQPREPQQVVTPTPTPIPLESYPLPPVSPVTSKQTTVFTVAFSPKDQEKQIQTYRTLPANTLSVASELASRLLVNPTITDDSGVRFWKSATATVTGRESPSRVSYQVSSPPTERSKGISDVAAEKLAEDALKESGAVGSAYTLVKTGITRFSGTTTHLDEGNSGGSLTWVGYTYSLSGLPVIDGTGGVMLASVTLDSTGKMIGLSAAVPPAVIPGEMATLIPMGQAILALTNNKGVLTSAQYERNGVGITVSHPEIKSATITAGSMKYLWDGVAQSIKPVYVFEGYSDSFGDIGKVNLLYFVAALP